MPRLWIGNFDFEHRLADPGRTPSARLQRLNAELAVCWLAVADDGDAMWTPEPVPPEFWDAMSAHGFPRVTAVTDSRSAVKNYDILPWGWTPDWLQAATRRNQTSLPSAEVVREANSRRWSFSREVAWNVGLPHAAACESLDDVQSAIRSLTRNDSAWVIKAEFGMSGRERILGHGPLTFQAIDWLRKRLRSDGVVLLEPWVDRIAEAGILFEVPATGPPQLVGVAEMLPSSQGQYAGSVFAGRITELDWTPAVEVAERAAVELQRLSYRGPLGIDAMWYRTTDGEPKLRPLQDVNARWTMGRLALGWRRYFPYAACGFWSHQASGGTSASNSGPLAPVFGGGGRGEGASAREVSIIASNLHRSSEQALGPLTLSLSPADGGEGTEPRIIPTSPDTIGNHPAHHRTALIVQPGA